MKLVFFFFVAALVGVYYYLKTRKAGHASTDKALPDNERQRFRAVSIRPGMQACRAARELVEVRFLPDEAPPLPLAGCDESACACRFLHHTDRRDEDDRRTPYQAGLAALAAEQKGNRREQDERRDAGDDDHLSL